MENLVMAAARMIPLDIGGKSVLVTGHTGFKGAWLCEWLLRAGARVSGIALAPDSTEALFSRLELEGRIADHQLCDIRDAAALKTAVRRAGPQIVFHMAAQALVRRSYREPLLTWETNVGGTLNLLEALRALDKPVTVVAVTTDKVYRNREWEFSYREEDELGGRDPYSASKAACEIAISSWRSSFEKECGVKVMSARAGNVIGGGDICEDRLVPDCFRAWSRNEAVLLRNPHSTRPWQHVLEPLSGYVALAAHGMAGTPSILACNFGPDDRGNRNVGDLVGVLAALGPKRAWRIGAGAQEHEARALSLSIDRARHVLGWQPLLSFEETLAWTNQGYAASGAAVRDVIAEQIAAYEVRAASPIFAP